MSKYSLEVMREVWDDDTGLAVEVGPDRDALGMVEIREVTDGKGGTSRIANRMSFPTEQAVLIARAMLACAEELRVEAEGGEKEGSEG